MGGHKFQLGRKRKYSEIAKDAKDVGQPSKRQRQVDKDKMIVMPQVHFIIISANLE